MTLLQVDGLRVVFRQPDGSDRAAVDDVGFAVAGGGALGIVGESGCGKSTLARALLGYVRPGARIVAGSVRLGEHATTDLAPGALRRYRGGAAALVPQSPLQALTPHMPVGLQVHEAVRRHARLTRRDATERVLQLFADCGLPDPATVAGRYPHELSGGQRQRVVIAASLAGEPSLMVLDEPTTALDKSTEAQILGLLDRIRHERGMTLVYISHDLNTIARMCDDVVVMRDGRIVEQGGIRQVFGRPRTDYARALVGAVVRLEPGSRPGPGASASPTLLAASAIRFRYGRRGDAPAVLDGVSFAVARGRTLGIVGESGSGKSTIAGLVAGLLDGAEGDLSFDGEALRRGARHRPRELRRRIQMVFQDPASSLNPRARIETALVRPMRLLLGLTQREARHRAAALMQAMELDPGLMARLPGELSGGQQQRVAIARAFAVEPDLVLCDEITSALDVTVQAQVLALMRRLQAERGTAYLFISHDLAVVAAMADDILVLERGQVRDHGPAAQVLARPRHAYTRGLIDAYAANVARLAATA